LPATSSGIIAGIIASWIRTDAGIAEGARHSRRSDRGERELARADREERQGPSGAARGGKAAVRLDVRLCCDLADVPPAAADAFSPRWIGCSPGASQITELAAPYARPSPPQGLSAGQATSSPPARTARAASDAAAGIASVLIVAEAERAEAERLLGPTAHPSTTRIRWLPSTYTVGWLHR
jgi:hypothetical protein